MSELKEIKIEVTYKCPLGCVHCSSNAGQENLLAISEDKCRTILADAIRLGVQEVAITGGEPLVWNGLTNIIDFVHSHNISTTIYTSGNTSDPEFVFNNLRKSGLNRAIFSIYSANKMEHNRITRKAKSFDLTLRSIDACSRLGITPEIHFVALAKNYSELSQIVDLAESHGVTKISVLRFVPQGRGMLFQSDGTLNQKQNLELKTNIEQLRKSGHQIRTGSPFNVLWLNEDPKCLAAQDRLIVAPDLRIYPCDAFKQIHAEDIVGTTDYSILDKYSLSECWEKSKYLNFVRQAISSQPNIPCNGCANYLQCKSGCAAQKHLHYGDLTHNPDPACLRCRDD